MQHSLVQKLAGVDPNIPEKEKKLPLLVTGRNQNTGEQTVETTLQTLDRFYAEGLMGEMELARQSREQTLTA